MRKAFTLIELLVVIAIIAILAAMLMPALARARAEARKASCTSNVKNLMTGFAMYQNDHGYMPGNTAEFGSDDKTGAMGLAYLREGAYIDSDDIFSCPANATDPRWDSGQHRWEDQGTDAEDNSVLGYNYDNSVPHRPEPMRVVMADTQVENHEEGSVAGFADKHAEYLQKNSNDAKVPNEYMSVDANIYEEDDDGAAHSDVNREDCYLGPDDDS